MKEIPLSQGKVALVDDADYEAVNIHKWYALKVGYTFYAVRNILKPDGKRTTQYFLFSVETDAARARDVAALKYYGEGAQLNFKVA